MRYVVTGAAGFIGAHLVARLLDEENEVVAIDVDNEPGGRLAAFTEHSRFRYIGGSLESVTDPEVFSGALCLFHLAANADIPVGEHDRQVDLRASVGTTHSTLERLRDNREAKLVLASSGSVYGPWFGRPFKETDRTQPQSLYAAGKLASEALVTAYSAMFGVNATVLRFGNVLGSGMTRGLVRDFIIALRANPSYLKVRGSGQQRKSFVLADDVVESFIWAGRDISGTKGLPLNISTSSVSAVPRVAALVAEEMGLSPEIAATGGGPSWPGDQEIVQLDVSAARDLGWRATTTSDDAVRISARLLLEEELS